MTPEQFHADPKASSEKFNLLNVNIRSLSKIFDKLKECVTALNCGFSVVGISETHLKDNQTITITSQVLPLNTPIETIVKKVVFVCLYQIR